MPSQCVAWNCATRRRGDETDDQTITFHSFPLSKPEFCAKWLEQMGEARWKPQRGSVLCSKHFDRDCFLQNYATPRLKPAAVPTHFDRRPNPDAVVDLDKRAADRYDIFLRSPAGQQRAAALNSRLKGRKLLRRNNPEEEVTNMRQLLEDERTKRRELEQEIYKLRQEKSEMTAKMSKLEQAKTKPNIPSSIIPILVDAMAKGVDPLKKTPVSATTPKRSLLTSPRAAPIRTTVSASSSPMVKPPPRKVQRTEGSDVSGEGGSSKVVLQLPPQMVDSSSKSVSFLVPVSSASTNGHPVTSDSTMDIDTTEPEEEANTTINESDNAASVA